MLGHDGPCDDRIAGGDGFHDLAVFYQDFGADVSVEVEAEDVQVAVGALEGEADLFAARQPGDQRVEAVVVRGE